MNIQIMSSNLVFSWAKSLNEEVAEHKINLSYSYQEASWCTSTLRLFCILIKSSLNSSAYEMTYYKTTYCVNIMLLLK